MEPKHIHSLYRGYIASWSISDDGLFLDSINSLAKKDKWEITMLNPKEDKNKRKLERELTKLINNQDNPNGGYWIHDQWVAPSRFMIPLLVKSNARDGKK